MARFPWSLVFDRTFSLSFPRIAYEEKGMGQGMSDKGMSGKGMGGKGMGGKGMSDKGMGTDWRLNSLAPKFLCPFRLRRLGIADGIDHRPHNSRHFGGAVG